MHPQQVQVLAPVHAGAGGSGSGQQLAADKGLMPPPTIHKTPAAQPVSEQVGRSLVQGLAAAPGKDSPFPGAAA
jgi:hypothetical protein